MKTIDAFYISVIVKEDEITTAHHFDYQEAETTMLNVLLGNFNPSTDDALIYMSEQPGEAKPIFNYRAYLNDEQKTSRPSGRENQHVKIFFQCPSCRKTEGALKTDKDGDIVMVCRNCSHEVFVK